jgi:hypothetical protein
LAALGRCFKKK